MKRIYLFVAALFIATFSSFAQQQMPPIPVDKDVRIGKLDNGLTYYIRKNNLPENQANFYIVQKVGSMQEEENQRGLAHFLEHMAFNGSKNFPNDSKGKGIIPYLETVGVKFGQNLNAGTSFDYTVYNIDAVPTAKQAVLDSCLLILHDWSGFLLLRDKETLNYLSPPVLQSKTKPGCRGFKPLPEFKAESQTSLNRLSEVRSGISFRRMRQ